MTLHHEAIVAWQNEREGWAALGRTPAARETFRLEGRHGLTCAWWLRHPDEMDNHVLADPTFEGDPHEVLGAVAGAIADSPNATTLRFLAGGAATEYWSMTAQQLGYYECGRDPLMACQIGGAPAAIDLRPEVFVRPAQDDDGHAAAFEVIQAVYGGPRELTRFFSPPGASRMYLASWDGVPAAAATVWPYAGAAGIYSVAVLPPFRRRGLASDLLRVMLSDLAREGFGLATLRTVDSLLGLYGALGFREVGRVHTYRYPKGSVGA